LTQVFHPVYVPNFSTRFNPAALAKDRIVPTKKTTSKKTKSSTSSSSSKKTGTTAKKKTASSKKKTAAKKAPAKKKTAAASTGKKTAASKKKAAPRPKVPAGIPAPRGRRVAEALTAPKDAPVKTADSVVKGKPLNKRELKKFQKLLLELRDRLLGDIQFLTTDNLHRAGRETGADLSGAAQHSADHGTDNFDREFALSLASTEQDVLYEVEEALMRIEEGGYGVCELTGVQIERARLEVIPYTRYSVQAQAKMEQGRARYRPFGQSFKGW